MQTSDYQPVKPSMPDHDFDQLKLLFDYTKFHIGLYTTLVTLLIALISFGPGDVLLAQKWFLLETTIFFILAGVCGGVVASNIPNYRGMSAFRTANFGPTWGARKHNTVSSDGNKQYAMWPKMEGPRWATWEHRFFWTGIFVAVVAVLVGSFQPAGLDPRPPSCDTLVLMCKPQ